jgi:hypothetical protein
MSTRLTNVKDEIDVKIRSLAGEVNRFEMFIQRFPDVTKIV